jgi:sugar phosphate isomerase/epimerase
MKPNKLGLSRRSLIGVAAGTGAAAVLGGGPATAGGRDHDHDRDRGRNRLIPRGNLFIQLFTIRDKVSQLGFRVVFEELARMGYEGVEFAGYNQGQVGPITVEEIRQLLDDNGLRAVGTHVGLNGWRNQLELELDRAEILGLRYAGTANAPTNVNTVAGYRAAAEEFNTIGAAARARGIRFYQHNHAGEFAFAEDDPSVRLYDVFLAETDPEAVFLQLDVYWAHVGQYRFSSRPDPAGGPRIPAPFDPLKDYVAKQPERFPLFHCKDGVYDTTNPNGLSFVDAGDGNIDYAAFIQGVEEARTRNRRLRRGHGYHFYGQERDDAPNLLPNPPGSFSSAERSADYFLGLRKGDGAC